MELREIRERNGGKGILMVGDTIRYDTFRHE
jgi:hypothetical protein